MMRMPQGLRPEEARRLATCVSEAIAGAQALYAFGSAVDMRLRRESDIDLAVLASTTIDAARLFDLAQACTDIVGRDVDLIDLRSAPLILQAQIVGRGCKLATFSEERAAAWFENQILSQYTAFVEERRPLVEEITRRGFVYAA